MVHARNSRSFAWAGILGGAVLALGVSVASADVFTFNSGSPDGKIAMGSRHESAGKIEIESADDFLTSTPVQVNHATFTGLISSTGGSPTIGQVVVEIYRVFPNDSNTARTPNVPSRLNSPSDVAFDSRDSAASQLAFSTIVLNPTFTAANSVLNGMNPIPNQTTCGEGSVNGQEVLFNVSFASPFNLPADHFFFVPQVQVTGGEFYWLSAPKPIVDAGTTPFTPDLQTWSRNANLDPDWLRVGTDIVGGVTPPTFNASFTLDGVTVPEPDLAAVLAVGLLLPRRRRSDAL